MVEGHIHCSMGMKIKGDSKTCHNAPIRGDKCYTLNTNCSMGMKMKGDSETCHNAPLRGDKCYTLNTIYSKDLPPGKKGERGTTALPIF